MNEWKYFVKAQTSCQVGSPEPVEVEECGLLQHALTCIKDQNLNNVDFEIDAKTIVNDIYNTSTGCSDFQFLISKYTSVAFCFPIIIGVTKLYPFIN